MAKIPVIIDTDPGIDDAMMLIYAFASDQLNIQLITTEAGNLTQQKTAYNARALVSYLQQHIEVAQGLEAPLLRKLEVAEDIHGATGLGNIELPEPTIAISERGAVRAMYEVLMASTEPMTIIATGPLTNIAALLTAHPEVKSRIERISWMGGSATAGNVTPTAEFNAYVDPHAAEIVFRSGLRILMSGLDVTHKAYVTLPETERIAQLNTPFSDNVVKMLTFYLNMMQPTPFHAANYSETLRFHDVCAVMAITQPQLFDGMDCFVEVVLEGAAAGTTLVDYTKRSEKQPNAHVFYAVQREQFVEQFIEAVIKMNERLL